MKLADLAALIGGTCRGDGTLEIKALSTLESAGSSEVTFLASSRLKPQLEQCRAAAVILKEEDLPAWTGPAIVCDDPQVAYARAARAFDATQVSEPGVHPSAIVSNNASLKDSVSIGAGCVIEAEVDIGDGAVLGPGCVVESGAVIGPQTRLSANVTVACRVRVGARCYVQSGAVLGSDGFGNAKEDGRWVRIPQLGGLVIGDDVQVGAGTTIDRGALGDTSIGRGVVIDNLVHIAHNVKIGEHTAIAACVAIAGSTIIGSRCTLAGVVGVADHVIIVDDVHLTGMSMVTGSITEPGVYSSGTGLMPNQEWRRSAVRFRQLDDLAKRLAILEKSILE
jgi:UDP-3-O-[3-hydroxymyristoyl] glucosamine N-acyltransferase